MAQSSWYVVYTKSRAEKKLYRELLNNGYEAYLPIYKQIKQWSDRKKCVEIPLFPSYLFIRIDIRNDYSKIISFNGVVSFVQAAGKPVPVKQSEIDTIKEIIEYGQFSIPEHGEEFNIGDEVIICKGPLKGLAGVLLKTKGSEKVLVNINVINKNIIIDIPSELISKSNI